MYDPPHLLKSLRNNLKKHGFAVKDNDDENNVKLDVIVRLYEQDSSLPIRMIPKVTRKHIELPGFSHLRVKYATQVLSHSVAAAITTYVSLGIFDQEDIHTAEFVEQMDKLFNCFNSTGPTGTQKYRYAISQSSDHLVFLDEAYHWLENVRCLGSRQPPSLKGWNMAINALRLLWEDLRLNHGFKFLYTNRLNQDCIENLFSIIRGKGGQLDNPDSCQFRASLRQVMVDRILIPSDSANCEADLDTFVFNMSSIASKSKQRTPSSPQEEEVDQVEEPSQQLPESISSLMSVFTMPKEEVLSVTEENIIFYIAGYISRKLNSKLCNNCQELTHGQLEQFDETQQVFFSHKAIAGTSKGGLVIPSPNLVEVCQAAETVFRDVVERIIHMDKVRSRIVRSLDKKVSFDMFNSQSCCPLKSHVLLLFTNIRLHHVLRENNRSFEVVNKSKKNRKVLKFNHL